MNDPENTLILRRLRMSNRIYCRFPALCAARLGISPAAAKATFAELLARAKVEAAAGHRLSPPGDNLVGTAMEMLDLMPTATPQQLAELTDLLQRDTASLGAAAALPASGPDVSPSPPV